MAVIVATLLCCVGVFNRVIEDADGEIVDTTDGGMGVAICGVCKDGVFLGVTDLSFRGVSVGITLFPAQPYKAAQEKCENKD